MREHPPHDSFEDFFDDDLRGQLDATAAEHRLALASRLVASLVLVRNRRTPLRGVESFGSEGVCRLPFADGTTVLARSTTKGGLGLVAVAVYRGFPVLLTDVLGVGVVVRAVLAWDGHKLEIDVVGSDQPT